MRADPGRREGAVATLSGGLDSAVAAMIAAERHALRAALFFEYGQHAAAMEGRAAERIAGFLGVELMRIPLPWLGALSRSTLVSGRGSPPVVDRPADGPNPDSRAVLVENRNGIFIDIAAAFAVSRGLGIVIVGFNREEAAAFPDNSVEFLRRINAALELGAGGPVSVESPTAGMTKRGIVEAGIERKLPWEDIWSCYRGGDRMCGRCESCARLLRAVEGTEARGRLRFEKEVP